MSRSDSRSLRSRRARLSIGLALSLIGVGYGLGGCGGEASQFPPPPGLGPAPEGGKSSTAGTTGENMGSLTGSGGDGGGEPTDGGKAGTTTGGTTAGTTIGGTAGTAGTAGRGGGDPHPNCGNDAIDADEGEECDDGNRLSGDGCSSQCKNKCEACEVTAYDYNFSPPGPQEPNNWRELCYGDETLAEGGPAAGVERNVLCHDLVECIRRTGCGKDHLRGNSYLFDSLDLTYCACANVRPGEASGNIPDDCYVPAKFEAGPCFVQMLEASEGDSITTIASRLTTATFPLARAVNLIRQFDYLWCEDECMACTGPGANGAGGTTWQPKGPCLPTQ